MFPAGTKIHVHWWNLLCFFLAECVQELAMFFLLNLSRNLLFFLLNVSRNLLNENPSATIVLPPEVRTSDNPNPCFAEVLRRNSAIKARPTHRKLKKDLIEHIWQRYGNKGN